jgi:hypothetical protein
LYDVALAMGIITYTGELSTSIKRRREALNMAYVVASLIKSSSLLLNSNHYCSRWIVSTTLGLILFPSDRMKYSG